MPDRPVLVGNSSSECRVHICGADRHNTIPNLRETGILEELRMENLLRNPNRSYSIWDTILYEKLRAEPNITLLLNCSCLDAEMDGNSIASVTGWQLTTQTYHTVRAALFADCSGDAVLAPLTAAEYRMGRESRHEYGESIAPETADTCTMGMTCLFQARKFETPQLFQALPWAYTYPDCEDLPYGAGGHTPWWEMGYWWVELGGEQDSIRDTEALRDELLKIVYGVWDHLKNRCSIREKIQNWALDWIQFLPAKRESRRYVGDHVLTQLDIEAGGKFPDVVGYGGWTMDDHHPGGFNAVRLHAPATIFHHAPSPYGIPYRALFSRNITNLMFAGRNASCTHAAMSSTRVMGTCFTMGQAIGTAAALMNRIGCSPREFVSHVPILQQELLRDDCYLPGISQEFSALTTQAVLSAEVGTPEAVRDGINRPVDADLHAWTAPVGSAITYTFAHSEWVKEVSLVLDSALECNVAMSNLQEDDQLSAPPQPMPKAFRLEGLSNGSWSTLLRVQNQYQRLVRLPVGQRLDGIRYVLEETWGSSESRLFAFYLD